MLFKNHLKYITFLMVVAGLSGCATIDYGTKLDSSTIEIETHRSRIADIGQVTVYQQKEKYLIMGKVIRNIQGRSHIKGHVDVELLNAQGKVVYETTTRYQHSGLRFNKEKFYLTIEKPIEKGSRLRITHTESTTHVE